MKRAIVSLLAALLVLLLTLSVDVLAASPTSIPAPDARSSPLEIVVRFRAGTTPLQMAGAHHQAGGRPKDVIPAIGVQVVTLPARAAAAALRTYAADPRIMYAEPDYVAEVVAAPNDPYFSSQWGLGKVEAAVAWDTTTGSAGVVIAILDTGVDINHPDLKDKIVKNVNFTGSSTYSDIQGHGTHVAGIAAASTNNGIGVAGLGYDASIMNVKVLGDDGSGYYSWVTSGIIWAADNGAQVINMSLGGTSSSRALEDAINYAWSKGVVVVAAAGNYGSSSPFYPAYYANCMAVAATDANDSKASWSNYGSWVDVAAPGVNIYSTLRGSSYGYKSGTSMASPFVAGLAALVFTTEGDASSNGLLNDDVRARIESTCDDIGLSGIGAGRINAARAVQGGQKEPQPGVQIVKTADPTSVSEADTAITYTYTVTNTGEVDLTGLAVADDRLGSVTLTATTLAAGAFTGGTATYTVTQADIDSGNDIVNTATVTCDQGVTDSSSATVSIQPPATPGVDITPKAQDGSGAAGQTVKYTYTVTNTGDEDDVYSLAATATWTASVSPTSVSLKAGESTQVVVSHTISGDAAAGASDSGTLTAASAKASADATFTTTVEEQKEPVAPVIDKFDLTNNSSRSWAIVTVEWGVSDGDGDLARVSVVMALSGRTVDSATFSVNGYSASGSCQLHHRSRRGTTYEIILTVTDAVGNTTSETRSFSR